MTTPSAADQLDEYPRRTELLGTASHRSWGCPLDIPVTGRIAGKPWRQAIDYANSRVLACYPSEHLVELANHVQTPDISRSLLRCLLGVGAEIKWRLKQRLGKRSPKRHRRK